MVPLVKESSDHRAAGRPDKDIDNGISEGPAALAEADVSVAQGGSVRGAGQTSGTEVLAGLVERVTIHMSETGFRKPRGKGWHQRSDRRHCSDDRCWRVRPK